jgi:predicted hotdog family 3-hydroxylacyl-ACP dehydratase
MKTTLSLPMPAEMLVPHRPPILVIGRLLEFNDTKGVVESCMHPDSIFAREDGSIEQVTMVEIIAQSFAAVKGYADLLEGKPISKGFLVGVKRLNIFGMAYKGDGLLTFIERVGETDEFSLAEGKVMREGQLIASGNVMVWVPKNI